MEEWKNIKGYEGLYQVSNLGRVKSLERVDNNNHPHKEMILKETIFNNGYYIVSLSKNGKVKKHTIHRLVAEAFLENPDNKPYIDHINTIRTDNRVENLRYATPSENSFNPITRVRNSETKKGNHFKRDYLIRLNGS